MPTQTFSNLSEQKQKKIFEAAVLEFSSRRFSEASINQIIKTAGISRGSFYQYFKDKEDLYLYMIRQIGKEKLQLLSDTETLEPDAGFFRAYLHMFRAVLEWAKKKPEYNRIGLLMELDNSQFIAKLREMGAEGFSMLKDMLELDKRRGLIKPDVDSALVVEMLYVLNLYLLRDDYRAGEEDKMLERFTAMLEIIKGGIARV